MNNLKEKNNLKIRFSRLKEKLRKSNKYYDFYLFFLWILFYFFKPIKKYILFRKKRWLWLISYSVFDIFWFKSWYIDDFVVSEKLRWKWIWKDLFKKVLSKINKLWCRYAFLFWNTNRKASIWLYKKFWFTVFSVWFLLVAYKKTKKKDLK